MQRLGYIPFSQKKNGIEIKAALWPGQAQAVVLPHSHCRAEKVGIWGAFLCAQSHAD